MRFILLWCGLTLMHKNASIEAFTLSMSAPGQKQHSLRATKKDQSINRRDALIATSATLVGVIGFPNASNAAEVIGLSETSKRETIDMGAIKAAQSKTLTAGASSGAAGVVPIQDPPPIISIRGGLNGKSSIKIPRVGYSFYKTAPDNAARCTALALRSGVRHFDVGTLYGSNSAISATLKKYLDVGIEAIDYSEEKLELLEFLDSVKQAGDEHAVATLSSGLLSAASPAPMGSAGRRGRREGLFISHKLSNAEQSSKRENVRRAVKGAIAELGCSYLDMVSIHSPLTDESRRRESYGALIELRDAGFVKSIGVCNYGVGALEEIKKNGFELPSMNQLELSPFNTHRDVVSWCKNNGIVVGCGAWSKLSGVDGPQDQWAVLAEIAKKKQMTKAQVLVRWSLQKGYVCVPRSASTAKIERIAIGENTYGGVNNQAEGKCMLTSDEMEILDGLNIDLKAGKLGRRDGWGDNDVLSSDWDPTGFV